MSYQTWLAQALRDEGLDVTEHPGWQTRGRSDLTPRWQIFHHTASAAGTDAPSLATVTNGRPDLAGPLCNVLVARSGHLHLIAAGTANHAGAGHYPDGTTGNHLSLGWECENNGLGEPWPDVQLDAIARGQAAACRHLDLPADRVIYHREYAPGRKPDPAGPGIPQDGNAWRAVVAHHLDNPGGTMPLTEQDITAIGLKVLDYDERIVKPRHMRDRRLLKAVALRVGMTPAEVKAALNNTALDEAGED